MSNAFPQTALLVATYHGSASQRMACEEHLEELALLVKTYGTDRVDQCACPVRKCDASTYIGKGKLEELVTLARAHDVDCIVFDDEITPAQQRNLEKAFGRRVMDRTEVILGVFAQRAQTREARLQIELAKIKYEAPRLKRLWTHLSRQQGTSGAGGGGAYLKGEGEKQIEIDRRILKRKIEQLEREIEEVKTHRDTQRTARLRSGIPVFAIIGYTNAGKSTLLNALTDAGVLVEDKLFATLDTTTRKWVLPNHQEVLLIDTVGFIRKLPHLLVAAFKSTLEEAIEADILLHLVDVSHPMAEEQVAATHEVLKELHASDKPMITVFNKIDRLENSAPLHRLRMQYPKNVAISALTHEGFEELQERMVQALQDQRRILDLRIPQRDYGLVGAIMREGKVLKQEYDGNDVVLRVDVPTSLVYRLIPYLLPSPLSE